MNTRRVESWVRYYTNKARRRRLPLDFDRSCNAEARQNVKWMLSHRKFVHRADCEWDDSLFAENIAILPRAMARSPRQATKSLVYMWMKSTGHRENIMNPDHGMMGVCVRTARNGDLWVSQTFDLGSSWKPGKSFWRWLFG